MRFYVSLSPPLSAEGKEGSSSEEEGSDASEHSEDEAKAELAAELTEEKESDGSDIEGGGDDDADRGVSSRLAALRLGGGEAKGGVMSYDDHLDRFTAMFQAAQREEAAEREAAVAAAAGSADEGGGDAKGMDSPGAVDARATAVGASRRAEPKGSSSHDRSPSEKK